MIGEVIWRLTLGTCGVNRMLAVERSGLVKVASPTRLPQGQAVSATLVKLQASTRPTTVNCRVSLMPSSGMVTAGTRSPPGCPRLMPPVSVTVAL